MNDNVFSFIKVMIQVACRQPEKYGYTDNMLFFQRLISFCDALVTNELITFSAYKTLCNYCFNSLILPYKGGENNDK